MRRRDCVARIRPVRWRAQVLRLRQDAWFAALPPPSEAPAGAAPVVPLLPGGAVAAAYYLLTDPHGHVAGALPGHAVGALRATPAVARAVCGLLFVALSAGPQIFGAVVKGAPVRQPAPAAPVVPDAGSAAGEVPGGQDGDFSPRARPRRGVRRQ